MRKVFCSVEERKVNPLFEVFEGGDLILSSYRDIEEPRAVMQIFFDDPAREGDARAALQAAMEIVGAQGEIGAADVPDEDWRYAYRRHFKTERIGRRLVVHPVWEPMPEDGVVVTLDPGMSFGTGKHETTRACLEYIDELAGEGGTMLDMGCGSGILSIAAAKLGYRDVAGFDVDEQAVEAARENAALNAVSVRYYRHALGGATTDENGDTCGCAAACADASGPAGETAYQLVVANILGPLLIRYADEIVRSVGRRLVVSGILNELYAEVVAAFAARGLREVSRKTIGEWTTGLLEI